MKCIVIQSVLSDMIIQSIGANNIKSVISADSTEGVAVRYYINRITDHLTLLLLINYRQFFCRFFQALFVKSFIVLQL